MTYKLSPSTIKLMLDCPRCFWLQLVKNIKRPDTAFPSLPNGMDKILKEHFDRFMEKGELPPELKEREGVNNCKLFDDKELLKVWRNNLKGIEYKDEESGVMLHGAVDNLLVKNNKLIVLDFKTRGFPLKENTHEYYQTQLDLYNFLLRRNGYETEDYSYLLFYYPNKVTETGEVIFNTELIEINTYAENGEKVFKEAVKVLQLKEAPRLNLDCGFCRWRENYEIKQNGS